MLQTRCYETERSLFLQPIVEAIAPVVTSTPANMLRQLLGEHATAAAGLLPEVAAILGPPPPGRVSMEMERRRAFEAVRALLRGLAERNPVLLLVDDLQYAGQSTVELMHFLGREPAGARLLVLATVRAENDAQVGAALAPVARRVEVGPLGPDAVAELARAAGHSELADRILEQTRGHTLFVVEVLGALASGEQGVPESLRTAVQARVRRAGPPVEALLRAAAVLGATVDPLTLGSDARPRARDRARAVRDGAGGQAARGQRPRLRVRQRPHPGGPVRQHAGADPAGLPPPGRRPADGPAGIAGQARRGGG